MFSSKESAKCKRIVRDRTRRGVATPLQEEMREDRKGVENVCDYVCMCCVMSGK